MATAPDWFRKRPAAPDLMVLDEPCVDDVFRSNIWHLRGKDIDLVIDTGLGLRSLSAALDLTPGKPVLAFATHVHSDHVGSFHEFADRAGPLIEAAAFETMEDRFTYADMFRALDEPVSVVPSAGWTADAYAILPAPLTRMLGEGDTIDVGNRTFKVLHLPGHSPGSLGLLDEKDGVFFSGDAIYDGELYDLLPDSDRAAYRVTMARIVRFACSCRPWWSRREFRHGARMRDIAQRYIRESRP